MKEVRHFINKEEWTDFYLHKSVDILRNQIKESEKLIDAFENACDIDDRDKSKVIEIDNALYDIVNNLKVLYSQAKFIKTNVVGKNSSYKNSLYDMNDYNESNEHFINIGDV